jgi:predicted N-acetyltransferase YhbS
MGVTMSAEREAYLKDQAGRRAFAMSFVGEFQGEVLGTVTLVPPSAHSQAWVDDAWDLRLLAVASHMQGKGIARKLLEFAEQTAREAGAAAICLHARQGVVTQAALYRACDYVRDPAGDLDTLPVQVGYRKDL